MQQSAKAEQFRQQHHAKELLILPNVWDALSAKLVAASGFPSLATASAAIALSNGYPDGEFIPFERLLSVIRQITDATSLPVSVDFERGFADNLAQLKRNTELLIENGAIGVNIEDGMANGAGLETLEKQCSKIEAIRQTANECGVPFVINARTDIFLQKTAKDKMKQAVERAAAYKAAGADCFYPILIDNYEDLTLLLKAVDMPVNIVLLPALGDLKKLENMGVARVSLGPGLLKAALTKMKNVTEGLLQYNSEALFHPPLISTDYYSN